MGRSEQKKERLRKAKARADRIVRALEKLELRIGRIDQWEANRLYFIRQRLIEWQRERVNDLTEGHHNKRRPRYGTG